MPEQRDRGLRALLEGVRTIRPFDGIQTEDTMARNLERYSRKVRAGAIP